MGLLATETHAAASAWIMGLFVVVMLFTYVGVAYKGLHKTVAALLGGGVLVLLAVYLGLFKYSEIYETLAKDLNVFGVIFGLGKLVLGETTPLVEAFLPARIEIEAMRRMVLTGAKAMDELGNAEARVWVSAVKAMVPIRVCEIIDQAIQMHGATGVSQVYEVARQLRGDLVAQGLEHGDVVAPHLLEGGDEALARRAVDLGDGLDQVVAGLLHVVADANREVRLGLLHRRRCRRKYLLLS